MQGAVEAKTETPKFNTGSFYSRVFEEIFNTKS
jgi:hypothetical protein